MAITREKFTMICLVAIHLGCFTTMAYLFCETGYLIWAIYSGWMAGITICILLQKD